MSREANNSPRGSKSPSSLALALDHLERRPGTYIFPIRAGAKSPPLIPNNLKNASNDPVQIKKWHAKWPGCNWGLALAKSHIIVADVDRKPGKVGEASYDAIVEAGHDWGVTFAVNTPSGGWHLYYKGEHVFKLNGFGQDIDSPNYTLLPGCELSDGGKYAVAPDRDVGMLDAPEWFAKYLTKRAPTAAGDNGAPKRDPMYPLDKCAAMLAALDPADYRDQQAWLDLTMSYHYITGGQGLGAFREWCDRDTGYTGNTDNIEVRWNSLGNRKAGQMKREDLFIEAVRAADADLLDSVIAAEDFGTVPPKQDHVAPSTDVGPLDEEAIDKAIDRIVKMQKINAKANAKAGEIDNAQRKVSELMQRYGLSDEDIKNGGRKSRLGVRAPTWDELRKEWVYVGRLKRFVERSSRELWEVDAFDKFFANVQIVGKAFSAPVSKWCFQQPAGQAIPRFKSVVYQPGKRGIVADDFNMWKPSEIVAKAGDTALWDQHLEYLFPDEDDRNLVLNWLAWIYRYQHLHPKHALLVHGEVQGTGKTFLVNVLAELIGRTNVTRLDQSALEADHNGWATHTKLIICEEVRPGFGSSNAVVKKLHPLISEGVIHIDMKNVSDFDMPHCMAVFLGSNKSDALTMDDSDRRFLIVSVDRDGRALQVKPKSYYKALYGEHGVGGMINDPVTLAAIAWQLKTRDLGGYNGQAAAPVTKAKRDMIARGESDLVKWIVDNAHEWPLNLRLVEMSEVIKVIPDHVKKTVTRGLEEQIAEALRKKLNGENLGKVWLGPKIKQRRLWALHKKSIEPLDRKKKFPDKVLAKMYARERKAPTAEDVKVAVEALRSAREDFGLPHDPDLLKDYGRGNANVADVN